VKEGATYIDGTVGNGGHAESILTRLGAKGRLLGIDRDAKAVERAKANLAAWGSACCVVHGNYARMKRIAADAGFDRVDGILLDLGVSSDQLETPDRGFSFQNDGPLDMRMDQSQQMTAADLLERSGENELRLLLRELGEERHAVRLARAIVRERSRERITSTSQLARIVSAAAGGRRGRIHPATRTFQAVRMAVNAELDCLEQGLCEGLDLLRVGGRMAVIAFHSLEDRMVKTFFRRHAGKWESLQAGGRAWRGEEPRVSVLTRKPIVPSAEEIERNPRARSAKLRAVERYTGP